MTAGADRTMEEDSFDGMANKSFGWSSSRVLGMMCGAR